MGGSNMSELNEFPWNRAGNIWKNSEVEYRRNYMGVHLKFLKDYEQEVMERLLLVRSEIDDAEQYLKGLQ